MLRHHCSTYYLDQEGTGTNAYNGGRQEAWRGEAGRVWEGERRRKEGGIWVGLVIDGWTDGGTVHVCVCFLALPNANISPHSAYFFALHRFLAIPAAAHSFNDIVLYPAFGQDPGPLHYPGQRPSSRE